MKSHVNFLGVLQMTWGAIGLVLGVSLLLLGAGAAAIVRTTPAESWTAMMTALLFLLFAAALGLGGWANMWVGRGLRQLRAAGRTGAFVVSGLIWGFASLYGKLRKRDVLGLGDVKMIAMLGAFLGLEEALFILCIAGFAGSLVGILYIVIAKKDWSTYELPYGSFIGAAGLAIALWIHVLRAH